MGIGTPISQSSTERIRLHPKLLFQGKSFETLMVPQTS